MRNFLSLLRLFALCLAAALLVRWYMTRRPHTRPPVPTPSAQNAPAAPQPAPVKAESPAIKSAEKAPAPKAAETSSDSKVGELRFADDAANRAGGFWLEQALEIRPAALKADEKDLLYFYIGLDATSMQGIRFCLRRGSVSLQGVPRSDELFSTTNDDPNKMDPLTPGLHILGVLWRNEELSIWDGPKELAARSSFNKETVAKLILKPSAVEVRAEGIRLGARRLIPLSAIRFDDTFMRDTVDGAWRPLHGHWELTALAFPERSANPFSLQAVFGDEKPVDDKLYNNRLRGSEFGIGVQIAVLEGTLHIARITGGSPAARAGLAEDDTFIEINGHRVVEMPPWYAYQLLTRGARDGRVRLKMLRPGEKAVREFNITRDKFVWGTPVEAKPIPPVNDLQTRGNDSSALILAGEAGWSDYAAEVAAKPLGAGGMGLAVGVLSDDDYVLFRWRGPDEHGAAPSPDANKLQLVRVTGGKEQVLAEKSARYRPYEFYRLNVNWSGEEAVCSVDGNEMLRDAVPGLKRGGIALYALKGEPVFFDDVHVASDRGALNLVHHPERIVNSIFAFENDMEVWANPALEWERDLKTGWAIHSARFPGEQFLVLNKPRFENLNVAFFCGSDPDSSRAPQLSIKDGKAQLSCAAWDTASRQVGPGPFQRIAVRASEQGAEVEIDGVKITAAPLGGPRLKFGAVFGQNDHIAIRGLKNLGDPAAARVTSSQTLEYTFDTSPVDWKVASGRWGLLNKWICDPRWSWFGGRSKTIAAVWNKNIFKGDVSVDGFVALMMQKDDPPYERLGDYNICLCGDGVNVDSGYTLIFGGDQNSWTRLYRKGVLAAESNKEEHRVYSDRIRHPDKPDLHQRWFHLKLEKLGNVISFYRDGKLAFSFNDPDPLPDGRLGFWTMDNGFLLARVRVAHGGLRPAPFESGGGELFEDGRVTNLFDGEVSTRVEREKLPLQIAQTMAAPESGQERATGGDVAASAALAATSPPVAHQDAYRVINATGGGPFALQWKDLVIDPESRGVLRFAYKIEPGAKVDLYLVSVKSGDFDPRHQSAFRWRLTGPEESDEFAPLAGAVPGVIADGRWHVAQFDLEPSWQALWKRRGFARPGRYMLRPLFGNLDNQDYLLAGMNGNHAGAVYAVSDMRVFSPREAGAQPPKVSRVIWPYDADGDGCSITLCFDDPSGSGVLHESIELSFNDAVVSKEYLDFDSEKQRLSVDLLKMHLPPLTAGQSIKLKLTGLQTRAQNAAPEEYSAAFAFDPAAALQAAKPVAAPVIIARVNGAGVNDYAPGNAALTAAEYTPVAPIPARLEESPEAPPWAPQGQRHSLRVVGTADGSSMGFQLNTVNYDLNRWPYLELDYKVPAETPFNLHLMDGAGALHALILTDLEDARDAESTNISSRFGPPADFNADGTWRRTTIPLLKLFQAANPHGESTQVNLLSFHDHGWRGGRRDLNYFIHRVQAISAGRAENLSFAWQAADPTGIVDFASWVDNKSGTDPMGKKELLSGESIADAIKRRSKLTEFEPGESFADALKRREKPLSDGWAYLHLRVKNGAGLWSEAVHRKFFLDNTPPQIVRTEPSDGGQTAGQTLRIFLKEEHGVDLNALRLSVNGVTTSPGSPGCVFDSATSTLTYNAINAGNHWPPHSKVRAEVQTLSDCLGNKAPAPYVFNFETNPALDPIGPAIAHLRYTCAGEMLGEHRQMDMELSFGLSFEEHVGHVHAMRDCRMDWLDDPAQAAFGRRAVRFTALQDDGDAQIMMHKNAWYIDNLPVLQFDYKADPGFKADLMLEVVGEWLTIQFTGNGAAAAGGKNIGRVADVRANGLWHHASVDLRALLDAAFPNLPHRIAGKIIFSAHGADGCRRGSTLTLDNFDLCQPQNNDGRFEWEAASDESGIADYSFLLNQNANDDAAPIPINSAIMYPGPHSGVWYAHVRARDQAGNWGPVKTMKIDFGE